MNKANVVHYFFSSYISLQPRHTTFKSQSDLMPLAKSVNLLCNTQGHRNVQPFGLHSRPPSSSSYTPFTFCLLVSVYQIILSSIRILGL